MFFSFMGIVCVLERVVYGVVYFYLKMKIILFVNNKIYGIIENWYYSCF